MAVSGQTMKSVFVALVLVALVQSASAVEKFASCCKNVSKLEITEPITGYMVQKPNPPCVLAVIFQTESGLYCSKLTEPWVRRKIVAFEKAKAQATPSFAARSSTASLLSVITSTTSTPPSSSSLSSSPSSSSSLSSSPSSSSLPSTSSLSSSPSSSSSFPSSSFPSFTATSDETSSGDTEE